MYLIASTKLRRARENLIGTQPYFNALRTEISRAFESPDRTKSPYVQNDGAENGQGVCGCLVLTADRGLAGAFNQNIGKEVLRFKQAHENTRFFVLGQWGRQFFKTKELECDGSFDFDNQEPSMDFARTVGARLLDCFDSGEIQNLYIIYTEMNGMALSVNTVEVLPLRKEQLGGDEKGKEMKFEPSADAVINYAVPGYVTGYIYSAMIENFCSEQNSRVAAMDYASDNAQELLDRLLSEYNHERQSSITQEITEVSAGARARLKHIKEAQSDK